ncbi:aromatic amino acid lyase, partial [Mesorhizobium sp. M2D.F.Ca.ET.145.01.1.1]
MLERIAQPRIFLCALTMTLALATPPAHAFEAATTYQPIFETAAAKTVTLTGHDLTIDQVIDIARNGAKVELSPEALQRSADAYGLLLEGAAEGIT